MNAHFDDSMTDRRGDLGDPVCTLNVRGDLNHSSYGELIEHTGSLYESGHSRLIIDLREVRSLGIAGLFALLSTAVIYGGRTPADASGGLRALHQMADAIAVDPSPNFKLISSQPELAATLRRSGLPVYGNQEAAIESFRDVGHWPASEQENAFARL